MLRDAMIMFRYHMRLSLREPVWIVILLVQPVLYLALFGPLLEPIAKGAGFPDGDPWLVFVPGLLVQLALFGTGFVGFELIADLRNGTLERMRVTPASRLGMMLGRVARDVVILVVQAIVLTIVAVPFGLRVPVLGVIIMLGIVIMLGIALSSFSYASALWLKREESLAPFLNLFSIPVLLLSGILLPMTLAPTWLLRLSQINPLSHVVAGSRAAFRTAYTDASLLVGLGCAAGLAVLGLWVVERAFRRESA